jgi:hypothetical protein
VSINVGAGEWFSRKSIVSGPDFLRWRWSLLHMHGRCDAGRAEGPPPGESQGGTPRRREPCSSLDALLMDHGLEQPTAAIRQLLLVVQARNQGACTSSSISVWVCVALPSLGLPEQVARPRCFKRGWVRDLCSLTHRGEGGSQRYLLVTRAS